MAASYGKAVSEGDEEWEQQEISRGTEQNEMRKERKCTELVREPTAASPLGTGR